MISKIRTLSLQQVAEVEDFVEFLAAKSMKAAMAVAIFGATGQA